MFQKRFCVLFIYCFSLVLSNINGLTIIDPRGPVPPRCLDCICDTVSECSMEAVCIAGDACGPYRITHAFWKDAGRPVQAPGDDVDHEDAFVNCSTDRKCSEKVVQDYMERNKKDCNGDGMIDCMDFFALHILGADCNTTLHDNFLNTYKRCDQPNKIVPAIKDTTNFFLPNYDSVCMRCICEAASGCNNSTIECDDAYCGMYKLSKPYWLDAGRPVIAGDDADRRRAFEDCALDSECAERTVRQYLKRNGRDCNGDRVTSCVDYLMIHFSESPECGLPVGLEWVQRYHKCMMEQFTDILEDPEELFR